MWLTVLQLNYLNPALHVVANKSFKLRGIRSIDTATTSKQGFSESEIGVKIGSHIKVNYSAYLLVHANIRGLRTNRLFYAWW